MICSRAGASGACESPGGEASQWLVPLALSPLALSTEVGLSNSAVSFLKPLAQMKIQNLIRGVGARRGFGILCYSLSGLYSNKENVEVRFFFFFLNKVYSDKRGCASFRSIAVFPSFFEACELVTSCRGQGSHENQMALWSGNSQNFSC